MRTLTFLFTLLFLASVTGSCQQPDTNAIDNQAFKQAMALKNAVVLDVRTPEEFSEGHIPGAKNMDVLQDEQFRKQILALPKDKTYLVYCRSGKRSFTALQLMKENGFADVKHLRTGMLGWDGPVEQ